MSVATGMVSVSLLLRNKYAKIFFHQPSNNIIGNLKHKIQNSTVLKNTNVFLFVFIQGKYKLIAKEWIGWTCDSHNKKDVRARRRRKIVWCFGMLLQAESFQLYLVFHQNTCIFAYVPTFPKILPLCPNFWRTPTPPPPYPVDFSYIWPYPVPVSYNEFGHKPLSFLKSYAAMGCPNIFSKYF